MPGILIIHASLGTGHASAAAALGDAFKRVTDKPIRVEDLLDYVPPMVSKTLSTMYLQTSEKGPGIYKAVFEASDKGDVDDAMGVNRLMSVLGKPFLKQFDDLIDGIAPEAIVSTHPLPLQLLSDRRQKGLLTVPVYAVVTDFMAHSTWFAPGATGYFVPSNVTRRDMASRGVAEESIHVTGIPVQLEVTEEKNMTAMRERHNLPNDLPLITLFAGGLDADRVRMIIVEMLEGETPAMLAVVAGRNERLEAVISDLGDGPQMRLLKLGKIDYVDDLVAASDMVITKAGGLIVSEVLARGAPMIIVDPIPGQEEWNADLVSAAGAGVQLRKAEMVPSAALYLLSQLDLLVSMRRQAQKIGRPRAALDVAQQVIADLEPEVEASEREISGII
jgi:processive 1,2-diacylglycerol beta-glucosyltransferase